MRCKAHIIFPRADSCCDCIVYESVRRGEAEVTLYNTACAADQGLGGTTIGYWLQARKTSSSRNWSIDQKVFLLEAFPDQSPQV